jgi:hypothetical protein
LTVVGQNFRAYLAETGAVLLQTFQNDLVAVIHVSAAKTRDIARAARIGPAALRRCGASDQNKRNDEKKSGHLVTPSKSIKEEARSKAGAQFMSMRSRRSIPRRNTFCATPENARHCRLQLHIPS